MLLTEDGLLMHLCFINAAGRIRLVYMTSQAGAGILGAHAPIGDKQLGDLLIHGQRLDIGRRTLRRRQAPIVDGRYRACTIDILKIQECRN